jgi:hypothetical protein
MPKLVATCALQQIVLPSWSSGNMNCNCTCSVVLNVPAVVVQLVGADLIVLKFLAQFSLINVELAPESNNILIVAIG